MSFIKIQKFRPVFILLLSVLSVSCVTETTTSPSMKFSDTSVISVQDTNVHVVRGSTIAWLPDAIRFYEDDRLQEAAMKKLIEKEIEKNVLAKELIFVESANNARYSVAYTAALESSLNDDEIIQRFGLLPGNTQVPKGDESIEKGSLIVYIFENRSADVVWRSAAQVGVKFDTPMEKRKARVERVLAEMFQSFNVLK